jgi:protein-histidine pros-kinase
VSLVLLDLLLLFLIVRPVAHLSAMADQISLGNLETPELPITGRDEIAILAESFNRMRRSLISAMKMLE